MSGFVVMTELVPGVQTQCHSNDCSKPSTYRIMIGHLARFWCEDCLIHILLSMPKSNAESILQNPDGAW